MIRSLTGILWQMSMIRRISAREICAMVMHHLDDPELADQPRQVFRRPEDLEAVDHRAVLCRIVVHEALDTRAPCRRGRGSPATARTPARPAPTTRQGLRVRRRRPRDAPAAALRALVERPRAGRAGPSSPPKARSVSIRITESGDPVVLQRVRQEERGPRAPGPPSTSAAVHEGLDLCEADVAPDEAVDAGQGASATNWIRTTHGSCVRALATFALRGGELESQQVRKEETPASEGDVQGAGGANWRSRHRRIAPE